MATAALGLAVTGAFQWESQSLTTEASPTGQRYIDHAHLGQRTCSTLLGSPPAERRLLLVPLYLL